MGELLEHRRAFYASVPHLSHDFTALRRNWLIQLFGEAGLDASLAHDAFDAFWHARNDVKPFPEAMALIESYSASMVLGTITNGNASVEHIGLGHHFDFIVTAADAGAMKPDRRIFEFALGGADIDPSDAVHVGDDPITDVSGARDFGMRTVWVNPAGKTWDDIHGAPPDAEVRHVAQMEPIIDAWRG